MAKKNTHIDVKDNGIKLANGIGDELSNLSHSLELHISKKLSEGTDNVRTWQIKQNNAIREFKNESGKIVNDTKKNIKEKIKNDDTVNLNSKQAKRITTEVNDGALLLQSNAIRTWENTKNKILTTLRVNSATSLKDEVAKHIDSGLKLDVVYKDGREYKFDTYFEMKARTDIQKDIADNMIKAGQAGGVVFYIAAYFGDCAKDHVDYQGKIYVDEKWESIAPKDRIEEIREYINSNNIMTVQDVVTEKGNFLTSRPNCRHYFQYVDIDSVIGAKTESDVSKLRDQMNLNFNGKYRPEKYEALQKQRLNERKIRAEKQEIEKQELELHLKPGNKAIQSKILAGEAKVRRIQAEQRELIKSYNNLERSYDREALGNRINLGTNKAVPNQADLTNKSNSGNINIEIRNTSDKQNDEFVEATSIEEAEDYAKNVLGIENVSYGKLDLKVINEMNKSLYKVKNANLQGQIKFVGSTQERNKALKKKYSTISDKQLKSLVDRTIKTTVKPISKYTYASSFDKVKRIDNSLNDVYDVIDKYSGVSINEIKGSNYDNMVATLKSDVKAKFHPIGTDTVEATIDHELGHQLDYKYDLRNNPQIQNIYNEAIKDKNKFTEDLSQYSWDNKNKNKYAEMIAEGWSEYKNNPKPREIATKIGNIIEELMKNDKRTK